MTTWIVIGVAAGLALVLVIVFTIQNSPSSGGKKKSGKVVASENQIDGYRLVNLMMTGQTSQVWEAAEISSGRHFAIKMLLPENVHSEQHRYFLFHEADVARQVVHPKIVKILAAIKDRDHPYLVMEYFPSTNLKLRLMRKDPFIMEHIKEIVEQTATALAYMHDKGWVHRDVKPDNILINASAEVRLIDFALAQRLSKRSQAASGEGEPRPKAREATCPPSKFGVNPWMAGPTSIVSAPRCMSY